MKGKILDYCIQGSNGVISGKDRLTYDFVSTEWKSDQNPAVNQVVEFTIDGENAVSVNLVKDINYSKKNKTVAALLALFLGGLGIHKFYLGFTSAGAIMLVVSLLGFVLLYIPNIIIGLIAFIEAIIYISKSDDKFQELYVKNQKEWF